MFISLDGRGERFDDLDHVEGYFVSDNVDFARAQQALDLVIGLTGKSSLEFLVKLLLKYGSKSSVIGLKFVLNKAVLV